MVIFPNCTFPGVSGGPNLIVSIVRELHRRGLWSLISGRRDTYLVRKLVGERIPFDFADQEARITATEDDTVILFHYYDGLHRLKRLPSRVIIWGILAPQITEWNRFGFEARLTGHRRLGDHFTRRLLTDLCALSGLVSMDGATSDAIDSFVGRSLDLPIVPIPAPESAETPGDRAAPEKGGRLRVTYVGRAEDPWKRKPVKKIVSDLGTLRDRAFEVLVYSTSREPFERELAGVVSSNVQVTFHLGLSGNALRTHLAANSDVHFSMGTAALEGAICGIPTVLIDPCSFDFPEEYRYRWLYESERCSLGRFLQRGEHEFPGMTIGDVVEACGASADGTSVGEKCREYAEANHSTANVVDRLLAIETRARMRDVVRNTPATWGIAGVARAASALSLR